MQGRASRDYLQHSHGRLSWLPIKFRRLLRGANRSLRGWRCILGGIIGCFSRQTKFERYGNYGLGLAFWENAGYLGVLGMFSLMSIYFSRFRYHLFSRIVFQSDRQQTCALLSAIKSTPADRLQFTRAGGLSLISFLLGYLYLLSASLHKRRYFLVALPMGLLDFFVPFANYLGIPIFELFIYLLGLGTLGITLFITKRVRT